MFLGFYLLFMLIYYLIKIDPSRRNNLLIINSENNNKPVTFYNNNIKCTNIQSAENCKEFSETIRQISNFNSSSLGSSTPPSRPGGAEHAQPWIGSSHPTGSLAAPPSLPAKQAGRQLPCTAKQLLREAEAASCEAKARGGAASASLTREGKGR